MSDCLNDSLNLVIEAVNKIKRHALRSCLFKKLCNDNDEIFENLMSHTEVRLLSKGNCLKRFRLFLIQLLSLFTEEDSKFGDNLV